MEESSRHRVGAVFGREEVGNGPSTGKREISAHGCRSKIPLNGFATTLRDRSTSLDVFEKRIQANGIERAPGVMQAERNPIDADNVEVKYLTGDPRGSSPCLPKNAIINPCYTSINSQNGLFHFFRSDWWRASRGRVGRGKNCV